MAAVTDPERLDSWKAIAEYLQRDAATVRRWEKTLGLPVHRVAGAPGRSVFAYTAEIDAWLKAADRSRLASEDNPQPAATRAADDAGEPAMRNPWRSWIPITALLAVVMAAAWIMRLPSAAASRLTFEASSEGVIALDGTGAPKWHYEFSGDHAHVLLNMDTALRVIHDRDPMILVATTQSTRRSDGLAGGGVLSWLDTAGRLRRSFAFDDAVTVRGQSFGAPWAMTSYAVEQGSGPRRIAVAAHHWTWEPSLVTILDENWIRRGTFVHAGWIEQVRWLSPDRLLVGGFSNARDGGTVALLDPARLDGQGPEPAGSPYHCADCGPPAPLRLVVMPRTEVNLAAAAPFNRTLIEVTPDRVLARTIEIPNHDNQGAADAIYEFSPALDLIGASFGERYWEAHRALEAEGKLDHPRERCPDRDGPRAVAVWEPATGWRTVSLR